MANDDGQERTETATQKRRDEAKREGRVPRSQELSAATMLLAGSGALAMVGGAALATHSVQILVYGTTQLTARPVSSSDMIGLVQNCLLYTSPSPRDTERSRMPSSA